MAVLLALIAALAYGSSDFLGGLASRRTSAWGAAVVVQVASTVSTAAVALTRPGSPGGPDLAWSVLAGLGSGVGVAFLFRGFGSGRMSVVAPLSAVGAALLPTVLGLAGGERPGALPTLAIVAAFPGIWLVAREPDRAPDGGRPTASGVLDGGLAGLGFGVLFVALDQVAPGSGFWPLTMTQLVSVLTVVALATALRASWRPAPAAWAAAPAGPLSAVAVICFQAAAQRGLLSVSSVLTSLYPAATILLAVVVLREHVHRAQVVGLLFCGATVTLVALG